MSSCAIEPSRVGPEALLFPKIPVSVLVVIHTSALLVLVLERIDRTAGWQSVTGSRACASEDLACTAIREVAEETGIVVGSGRVGAAHLVDWHQRNVYEIDPAWRHRYSEGVTHNTEHVFSLRVPDDCQVILAPREHSAYRWLPWPDAAVACFSSTNAAAIRQLPLRLNAATA